jgi:tetratricopeptide (TPR) repeat protein
MSTYISVPRLGAVIGAILLMLAVATPSRSGGVDFYNKGQEAEKAGNRNAAIEAYTQAIQAGDLTGTQLAGVFFKRGSLHGLLGNYAGGIDDFSVSIQLNPKLAFAFSMRGYLRGITGQYDLAEKDYGVALDLAKEQKWENYLPWVLELYADLWRRRGEFDKALSYCEKALQAKAFAPVYFRRAWIYLDMGRTAQAKADIAKFDQEMKKAGMSSDAFFPVDREAITKLREIR